MGTDHRLDQWRFACHGARRPGSAGTALAVGCALARARPRAGRSPLAKPARRQFDVFLRVRCIPVAATTASAIATGRLGRLRSTARTDYPGAAATHGHEV